MRKDDSLIFKRPKNRIEELLKHEILKRRLNAEQKKEKAFDVLIKKLKVSVPLQIIIGIAACVLMYYLFGGRSLLETLLSWTIGMTIIATIITSILSKYHKEK
ncbi:hypothetical protein KY345_04935 [Candidatus Woesearchaeota archaeon]|nr:hypothetical protein [Candidatus Woesearchaeota archaeon]